MRLYYIIEVSLSLLSVKLWNPKKRICNHPEDSCWKILKQYMLGKDKLIPVCFVCDSHFPEET